jgi:hypothetical protein
MPQEHYVEPEKREVKKKEKKRSALQVQTSSMAATHALLV